jgi:4-hydroxy-4-methyl-2-oxoglutarate aldolase
VIVGDEDGVVVVPRALIESVIRRLAEVIKAEKALQARIAKGVGGLDGVAELMRSDRVRYLE